MRLAKLSLVLGLALLGSTVFVVTFLAGASYGSLPATAPERSPSPSLPPPAGAAFVSPEAVTVTVPGRTVTVGGETVTLPAGTVTEQVTESVTETATETVWQMFEPTTTTVTVTKTVFTPGWP